MAISVRWKLQPHLTGPSLSREELRGRVCVGILQFGTFVRSDEGVDEANEREQATDACDADAEGVPPADTFSLEHIVSGCS